MQKQNSSKNLEKGIYVESKPVIGTSNFFTKHSNKYGSSNHLYIIYRDGKGNERIIRGGPANDSDLRNLINGGGSRIEVQKDIPLKDSRDAYGDGTGIETRFSKKLDISDAELDKTWENFNKSATKIDNLGIDYHNPQIDDKLSIQNSNSTIRTILEDNNFNAEENYPQEVKGKIPGFETNLFKDPRLTQRLNIDSPDAPILMDPKEQETALEHLKNQDKEREIFQQYQKNNNPMEDILFKKDDDITEDEIKNASKHAMFETNDNNFRQRLNNKITGWYSSVWGDEPVKTDATGRNIEPQPKRMIAQQPKPLTSKEGLPLNDAFNKLVPEISRRGNGITDLQKSINKGGYQPALKEDGVLGPKTASGIKDSLVKYGSKGMSGILAGLSAATQSETAEKQPDAENENFNTPYFTFKEEEKTSSAQSPQRSFAANDSLNSYRRKRLI